MSFAVGVGGIVGKMNCGQLERATYDDVNKYIASLGGKWIKKLSGHIFEQDPRPQIAALLETGELKIDKDGYFPTPRAVVEIMINMAQLSPEHIVLEPSAGVGHIADLVKPLVREVDCIEINEQRRAVLEGKGYVIVCDDFMASKPTDEWHYDRVIMNPPFEDGQDIAHVRHAFEKFLKPGGLLVSVVAESVFFRTDKKYQVFHDEVLDVYGAEVEDLPAGAFAESGTQVKARIVTLAKPYPAVSK